jgi:AcrR family transcriptional regulator
VASRRGTAETILDTAERLCALHGIEAVSIRDIAAEADVSIAVIYHHYKSKARADVGRVGGAEVPCSEGYRARGSAADQQLA